MKKIPLTQGMMALVDDEDYEGLARFKWHYAKSSAKKTGYAMRKKRIDGKKKSILMHRVILKTPPGCGTDHRNGNGLDNRRNNLRVATVAQNGCNRGKQKNNASGHKGVGWHKGGGKWQARIRRSNKLIHLGLFKDKTEAARAYNTAAIKLHGKFARLNQVGVV